MALAILKYVSFNGSGRRFFLFDTFSGLVPELSSEQELRVTGGFYGDCFDEVVERFASYPEVVIVRGKVPASLTAAPLGDVAFVHLDLNAARPTRSAIDFFWPRLVPAGIILLDDYGWTDNAEQKATLDEFAAAENVEILCLPTGQGMLLKPLRPRDA
jgi:hypothetical protein